MPETYDAIIIGAGAMGSAAAYYLSKRGQKVLLLEQFELDHKNGSSYGVSRIIRYSYNNPEYVELAKDNFPLWFELEEELGETLYVKTGGIDFGLDEEPMLRDTIEAVTKGNIEHEILGVDEAHKRFPQFRFREDFTVMYQPDSGLIRASKAVLGHIKLAQKHGATVIYSTSVKNIKIQPDSVQIVTENETYSAGKLIITAGAWAKSLMTQTGIDLPLTPMRCQLNFLMPDNLNELYSVDNCPIWIAHVEMLYDSHIYGLPSLDNSGFKIAYHSGPTFNHPSEIDRTPNDDDLPGLREFARHHIPGVADSALREHRVCLYTMTPDEHFIVDLHPEYRHIAIGAGFSGHGFKFSTIIGKMLTELVLDGKTPHNDNLFKIDRFLNP